MIKIFLVSTNNNAFQPFLIWLFTEKTACRSNHYLKNLFYHIFVLYFCTQIILHRTKCLLRLNLPWINSKWPVVIWFCLVSRNITKNYNRQSSLTKWRISLVLYWQISFTIRDHSFSTYTKFSEKLTFLTPWYAQVRFRIRG